ncbi:hypothetical protein DFH94DRAFT_208249 [Russula ochroleuca]|uniref:Uncharacterized protein n=1 Tax=Russula ochroleuca TaxID=152965 RepID=A0A9P5JZ48_9AGAM|nr:hypothetical protein DFH94DRAFT_208249 [Russula ochroleuca]
MRSALRFKSFRRPSFSFLTVCPVALLDFNMTTYITTCKMESRITCVCCVRSAKSSSGTAGVGRTRYRARPSPCCSKLAFAPYGYSMCDSKEATTYVGPEPCTPLPAGWWQARVISPKT